MPLASLTFREQLKYPTTDGKPMAETDIHRELMFALIHRLQYWFADVPKIYVSGNLLLFYQKGNKRKHVSPDVFVVPGVSKKQRLNFLTWEERRNPAFIIEVTSSSTKSEDISKKYLLYRDVLKVKEYFLYDPTGDYLDPPLRGYRLHKGVYLPIDAIDGRLPSRVVGLHLEPAGKDLRLYDAATGEYVPTPEERVEQAEDHAARIDRENAAMAAENERLRAELESLRQPKPDKKNGR